MRNARRDGCVCHGGEALSKAHDERDVKRSGMVVLSGTARGNMPQVVTLEEDGTNLWHSLPAQREARDNQSSNRVKGERNCQF